MIVKTYSKTRIPVAPLAYRAPSHLCERNPNMAMLMVASLFTTLSSTTEVSSSCYMEKFSMKRAITRKKDRMNARKVVLIKQTKEGEAAQESHNRAGIITEASTMEHVGL